MGRNRVFLVAIASAGLLLSAVSFAEEPPFQNSPGASKPPPPPEPPPAPVFTEEGGGSAGPKPSASPRAADPAPPAFGEGTSPAAPSAAAPPAPAAPAASAPPPVMPSLRPIESSTAPAETKPVRRAPARAAPARERARPEPKRAAAAPQPAPRSASSKKRSLLQQGGLGPIATFPAFHMMEGGGSRVFVKLSGRAEITEHKAEGRVVYCMQGASVPTRTNRLPLDTSFFATPVSQVRLVPQGGDVDLVIELRQASEAQHRIEEQRDGVVLIVDFPRVLGVVTPDAKAAATMTTEAADPLRARRPVRPMRVGSGSGPEL